MFDGEQCAGSPVWASARECLQELRVGDNVSHQPIVVELIA